MPLSYKDVAEILKIIDASDCEELVIEMGDTRLVVRRQGSSGEVQGTYTEGDVQVSGSAATFREHSSKPGSTPEHGPDRAQKTGALTANSPSADGASKICAPMVGTFYRAPSPQDPPFVEVGDNVEPGDPLCLIEVMKLYTTIEAAHAGRIGEVCVEDGALVEFDQLLFVIAPA